MLDARTIAACCRPVFDAEPGVRAAFLFGSVARGKARADSDVDIAVVGRDVDVLALGAALGALLRHEVDVVEIGFDASIPLLRSVLRDGRRVYERHPGDAAEFSSRALTVLDLDGPAYDYMIDRFMARVARRGVGT
jgi:predicted nucleotidyltransferase